MTAITDLGVAAIRDGFRKGEFAAREVAKAFNEAVAGAVALLLGPVPGQHHVGVVGGRDRGEVGLAVAGHQDRGVAAGEAGEVGDDRLDVVGADEQHQPPNGAELGGAGGDPLGEVRIEFGARVVRLRLASDGVPYDERRRPEAGVDLAGSQQASVVGSN